MPPRARHFLKDCRLCFGDSGVGLIVNSRCPHDMLSRRDVEQPNPRRTAADYPQRSVREMRMSFA